MGHLPDEHRCEEHEDEGLKEGDEQFKETDWNRRDDGENGNRARGEPVLRSHHRHGAEGCDHGQEGMPGHHVGEEADCKRHRLDEQPEQFDRQHDRQQVERCATGKVAHPAFDTQRSEALILNGDEGQQRQTERHGEIRCRRASKEHSTFLGSIESSERVLQIEHRNQAEQIAGEDEEEEGQQEGQESIRVLAENRANRILDEVHRNDLDELRQVPLGEVAIRGQIFRPSLDGGSSTKQDCQTDEPCNDQRDHMHGQRTVNPVEFLIDDMTDWVLGCQQMDHWCHEEEGPGGCEIVKSCRCLLELLCRNGGLADQNGNEPHQGADEQGPHRLASREV